MPVVTQAYLFFSGFYLFFHCDRILIDRGCVDFLFRLASQLKSWYLAVVLFRFLYDPFVLQDLADTFRFFFCYLAYLKIFD